MHAEFLHHSLLSHRLRGHSPVALPGVSHVVVCDGVLVRLLVKEVEHVLDRERQRTSSVGRAEYRLKQVIHKLL